MEKIENVNLIQAGETITVVAAGTTAALITVNREKVDANGNPRYRVTDFHGLLDGRYLNHVYYKRDGVQWVQSFEGLQAVANDVVKQLKKN